MSTLDHPHVVLLVTDGVGYRNFVLGNLCHHLPGCITVLHDLHEPDLEHTHLQDGRSQRIQFERLPPFREAPKIRLLREAKSLSQLYRHSAEDAGEIQLSRLRPRGRLRNRALLWTARLLARLRSSQPDAWDEPLRKAVARSSATRNMRLRLKELAPDVIFCTHQRASAALPTMTAASTLGIPTATFVFSWDNLPKGRMPVVADQYLVWGPRMAEQMSRYFPEVAPSRVTQVGTPQFEPYFEEQRFQDKEQFCQELGLDPQRPIVCFSGDDESTSPKDPVFLRDLARGLRQAAPEASNVERPQILFRRCPVDLSGRYDAVLEQFPEIVAAPPRWLCGTGDWQGVLPTSDDISHLVSLVRHCDLVVNLGSTMGMDFAIFDKPAIFLAYEPEGRVHSSWNTSKVYQLPHFRAVHRIGPVHWAKSAEALGPLVLRCLERPQELRVQRQEWINEICIRPLHEASQRCAQAITGLATGK